MKANPRRIPLEYWMLAAGILVRIWLSWARAHWDHPDEWYQTLELAQVMRGAVSGQTWGVYSQEIDLHLRNLTLPGVFALLLSAVQLIWNQSLRAPLFAAQLLSTLWSLALPAALWRWARPHRWFPAALLGWAFLPFWAIENTKPSAENWSMHAFFWALFFLMGKSRLQWTLAGFSLALTAAFKFPAALLVLGFAWGVWRSALHTFKWRALFLGFGVGGMCVLLPDAYFYGLPGESLFAYLEYNVLTPLGADVFGRQSAWVYLEYLRHHWLTTALPLTLWITRYLPQGIGFGFSRHAPWAVAAGFYLLGHLFIGHKEGRFFVPVEGLAIFAAGIGTALQIQWTPRVRAIAGVLALLTLLLGGKTWSGDLHKLSGTYFALDNLPENQWKKTCGVVTGRRMQSFLLPPQSRSPQGRVAFAMTQTDLGGGTVVIWDRVPKCGNGDQILVHMRLESPPEGCEHLVRLGPDWMTCAAEDIPQTQVQHPYVHAIPRVTHYPRLGRTGIVELLQRKNPPSCTIAWCGSV